MSALTERYRQTYKRAIIFGRSMKIADICYQLSVLVARHGYNPLSNFPLL